MSDIQTLCKDCIFAQWAKIYEEDKEQIGCELGRIDKFLERNEAYFETKLNSFVINRFCNACRNHEWLSSEGNTKEKAIQQTAWDYSVALLYDKEDTLENMIQDIYTSYLSLINQDVRPQEMVVIYKNNKARIGALIKDLRNKIGSDTNIDPTRHIEFMASHVVEKDADMWRMLDIGIPNCVGAFYTILHAGNKLPPDFSKVINDKLNKDLEQFVMILPYYASYDGLTFSSVIHNLLQGNAGGIKLYDKVVQLAEENKQSQAILDLQYAAIS